MSGQPKSSFTTFQNKMGTHTPFKPVVGGELDSCGSFVLVCYQAISVMEEYCDKSFEELRLEDYRAKIQYGRQFGSDALSRLSFGNSLSGGFNEKFAVPTPSPQFGLNTSLSKINAGLSGIPLKGTYCDAEDGTTSRLQNPNNSITKQPMAEVSFHPGAFRFAKPGTLLGGTNEEVSVPTPILIFGASTSQSKVNEGLSVFSSKQTNLGAKDQATNLLINPDNSTLKLPGGDTAAYNNQQLLPDVFSFARPGTLFGGINEEVSVPAPKLTFAAASTQSEVNAGLSGIPSKGKNGNAKDKAAALAPNPDSSTPKSPTDNTIGRDSQQFGPDAFSCGKPSTSSGVSNARGFAALNNPTPKFGALLSQPTVNCGLFQSPSLGTNREAGDQELAVKPKKNDPLPTSVEELSLLMLAANRYIFTNIRGGVVAPTADSQKATLSGRLEDYVLKLPLKALPLAIKSPDKGTVHLDSDKLVATNVQNDSEIFNYVIICPQLQMDQFIVIQILKVEKVNPHSRPLLILNMRDSIGDPSLRRITCCAFSICEQHDVYLIFLNEKGEIECTKAHARRNDGCTKIEPITVSNDELRFDQCELLANLGDGVKQIHAFIGDRKDAEPYMWKPSTSVSTLPSFKIQTGVSLSLICQHQDGQMIPIDFDFSKTVSTELRPDPFTYSKPGTLFGGINEKVSALTPIPSFGAGLSQSKNNAGPFGFESKGTNFDPKDQATTFVNNPDNLTPKLTKENTATSNNREFRHDAFTYAKPSTIFGGMTEKVPAPTTIPTFRAGSSQSKVNEELPVFSSKETNLGAKDHAKNIFINPDNSTLKLSSGDTAAYVYNNQELRPDAFSLTRPGTLFGGINEQVSVPISNLTFGAASSQSEVSAGLSGIPSKGTDYNAEDKATALVNNPDSSTPNLPTDNTFGRGSQQFGTDAFLSGKPSTSSGVSNARGFAAPTNPIPEFGALMSQPTVNGGLFKSPSLGTNYKAGDPTSAAKPKKSDTSTDIRGRVFATAVRRRKATLSGRLEDHVLKVPLKALPLAITYPDTSNLRLDSDKLVVTNDQEKYSWQFVTICSQLQMDQFIVIQILRAGKVHPYYRPYFSLQMQDSNGIPFSRRMRCHASSVCEQNDVFIIFPNKEGEIECTKAPARRNDGCIKMEPIEMKPIKMKLRWSYSNDKLRFGQCQLLAHLCNGVKQIHAFLGERKDAVPCMWRPSTSVSTLPSFKIQTGVSVSLVCQHQDGQMIPIDFDFSKTPSTEKSEVITSAGAGTSQSKATLSGRLEDYVLKVPLKALPLAMKYPNITTLHLDSDKLVVTSDQRDTYYNVVTICSQLQMDQFIVIQILKVKKEDSIVFLQIDDWNGNPHSEKVRCFATSVCEQNDVFIIFLNEKGEIECTKAHARRNDGCTEMEPIKMEPTYFSNDELKFGQCRLSADLWTDVKQIHAFLGDRKDAEPCMWKPSTSVSTLPSFKIQTGVSVSLICQHQDGQMIPIDFDFSKTVSTEATRSGKLEDYVLKVPLKALPLKIDDPEFSDLRLDSDELVVTNDQEESLPDFVTICSQLQMDQFIVIQILKVGKADDTDFRPKLSLSLRDLDGDSYFEKLFYAASVCEQNDVYIIFLNEKGETECTKAHAQRNDGCTKMEPIEIEWVRSSDDELRFGACELGAYLHCGVKQIHAFLGDRKDAEPYMWKPSTSVSTLPSFKIQTGVSLSVICQHQGGQMIPIDFDFSKTLSNEKSEVITSAGAGTSQSEVNEGLSVFSSKETNLGAKDHANNLSNSTGDSTLKLLSRDTAAYNNQQIPFEAATAFPDILFGPDAFSSGKPSTSSGVSNARNFAAQTNPIPEFGALLSQPPVNDVLFRSPSLGTNRKAGDQSSAVKQEKSDTFTDIRRGVVTTAAGSQQATWSGKLEGYMLKVPLKALPLAIKYPNWTKLHLDSDKLVVTYDKGEFSSSYVTICSQLQMDQFIVIQILKTEKGLNPSLSLFMEDSNEFIKGVIRSYCEQNDVFIIFPNEKGETECTKAHAQRNDGCTKIEPITVLNEDLRFDQCQLFANVYFGVEQLHAFLGDRKDAEPYMWKPSTSVSTLPPFKIQTGVSLSLICQHKDGQMIPIDFDFSKTVSTEKSEVITSTGAGTTQSKVNEGLPLFSSIETNLGAKDQETNLSKNPDNSTLKLPSGDTATYNNHQNKTNEIKREPKLSGHENKGTNMKKKLEEGNESKLKMNELFKPINKSSSMNIAEEVCSSTTTTASQDTEAIFVSEKRERTDVVEIFQSDEVLPTARANDVIEPKYDDTNFADLTSMELNARNESNLNENQKGKAEETKKEDFGFGGIHFIDRPSTSTSTFSSVSTPTLEPTSMSKNATEPLSESTSTSFSEPESEVSVENYFIRPHKDDRQLLNKFFSYHPNQPEKNVPLTAQKMYSTSDGVKRMWITYRPEPPAIFCSLCLAFGDSRDSSTFITGNTDWRHIYSQVIEHEKSKSHRSCVDAYILYNNSASVDSLVIYGQSSVRKSQVNARRQVLYRIIDVIKLIGKCNLSYRGDQSEATYTLHDVDVDHGNFLELINLLGKYDPVLRFHLDTVIVKSAKSHENKSKQGGRNVTILSKTTVNYIIEAMAELIKQKIASQVREAGIFLVQLYTTQDITSSEHCSIVIRYLHNTSIKERLIGLIKCTSTEGDTMAKMLLNFLEKLELDPRNCIGNSTDGASNMQGVYRGFSAKLSEYATKQVHIWCHAHILNLVISDVTHVSINAISLFQLINGCAVFLQESHKLMDRRTDIEQLRRLNIIGETRWWAKHKALFTVFGSFQNPSKGLFVKLVVTLYSIQEDKDIISEARVKAKGFLEAFCKYETILTAQLFLRIFEKTTPFSEYLQTKGIDLLKVYQLYQETVKSLELYSRDFVSIQKAAEDFVKWANTCLEEQESDILIENELPQPRIRKKKKQFDYEGEDGTANLNALSLYEFNVHNVILDEVVQSMKMRFEKHGELCADFACMDPRNFDQDLPTNAMDTVFLMISEFKSNVTQNELKSELKDFRAKYKFLKKDIKSFYNEHTDHCKSTEEDIIDFDSSDEFESESKSEDCSFRKKFRHDEHCILSLYKLLIQYNMYCHSYPALELAYRLLLTLSVTQVCCERCFSKLKIIKNRLRNPLGQDLLECFMMMSCEKDILMKLDENEIIDKVAAKSSLLSRLLCL